MDTSTERVSLCVALPWPPYSPTLTLATSFWGVFERKGIPKKSSDFRGIVNNAKLAEADFIPLEIERTINSMAERVNQMIQAEGGRFKQ